MSHFCGIEDSNPHFYGKLTTHDSTGKRNGRGAPGIDVHVVKKIWAESHSISR